ncbi:MAG: extracellular solute-binding protein, partial [Clostridia bacterium]|nr:extracellular solute-binding protein [Clostridia bacterium]
MKRILCLMLAVMMLVSIVACGEKTPATSNETTTAPTGNVDDVTTEVVTTEDPNKLPDYIPTDKYDGHEFIVLMTNLNADQVIVRDFNWTEGGTVLDDALYKRNMSAMEALDITITGIEKYSSSNSGVADVRKANTAGDSSYDMCIISTYDAGTLALSGDLSDLRDYGVIDLDQQWWDQNINRDITVNGKLFFTTGDISLVATQAMYNMVFNKDLYREKFGNTADLYNLVKEGKWTFDKMKEYVIQVSEDLDGNEIMDSNDLYGMVYIHSSVIAALGMSGERMARVDDNGDVVVTLGTERAENAIVKFIELTLDKQHVLNGQTATGGLTAVQMFSEGHCLFRWIEHLGFPHFRDTELDYGILPLPKTEDSQD